VHGEYSGRVEPGEHIGPVAHDIVPAVVHSSPLEHGAPGVQATQFPAPSHTPPAHTAPAPRFAVAMHVGAPLPHAIDPVRHPISHESPGVHATHVPLPSQTPPAHADPGERAAPLVHTGMPLEQSIAPSKHSPVDGVHAAPAEHPLQWPAPSQTPPGQGVPAFELPEIVQTGMPLEQFTRPSVHGAPVEQLVPAAHATHVPDPLHTPPGHAVPAG
jgi:hypothetical protein